MSRDGRTFICQSCARELSESRLAESYQNAGRGLCVDCNKNATTPSWSSQDFTKTGGSETTELGAEVSELLDKSSGGEKEQPSPATGTISGQKEGRETRQSPDLTESVESSKNREQAEPQKFWSEQHTTRTKSRSVPKPRDDDLQDSSKQARDLSPEELLSKKIENWKSQLLDLTRRNSLINFKATKTKSLPLGGSDLANLAACFEEDKEIYVRKAEQSDGHSPEAELAANELVSSRDVDSTDNSLYRISRNHKSFLRERGVDTLYLSLGMLHWYSVEYSAEVLRSPLILVSVSLEQKTNTNPKRYDYEIKPKDEVIINPALRKKLKSEFDISLPSDGDASLETIDETFETLYQQIQGFERWEIKSDVVLGIFDFAKFSLYSDLDENRDKIQSHPVISALTGNTEPIQKAEGNINSPRAEELDSTVSPNQTFQVLDADSSQQEAIEAAKSGKSFVLQGPPGTGKSQTISNIIAEKLAADETVLFVSEKQAALDVVKNRLENVGIGRFCLEVHGKKADKTKVLQSLERELNFGVIKSHPGRADKLSKLKQRRDELNAYGDSLFTAPKNHRTTPYQAFGIVSNLEGVPTIDLEIDSALAIAQDDVEKTIEDLSALSQFEYEIANYTTHPWKHTTLTEWRINTVEKMQSSIDAQLDVLAGVQLLAQELRASFAIEFLHPTDLLEVIDCLKHLRDRPEVMWQETHFSGKFLSEEARLREFIEVSRQLAALRDDLDEQYEQSFYSEDGADLHAELNSYGFFRFLSPSYRKLKKRIFSHVGSEYKPDASQLKEDARKLMEIQQLEARIEEYDDLTETLGSLYQGSNTEWDLLLGVQEWVQSFIKYDCLDTEEACRKLYENEMVAVEAALAKAESLESRLNEAQSYFEASMQLKEVTVQGEAFDDANIEQLSSWLDNLRANTDKLKGWVQFKQRREDLEGKLCDSYLERFLTGDYEPHLLADCFKKRYYTLWLNEVYEQTDLGRFNISEFERRLKEFRKLDQQQREIAKAEVQHRVTKRRPRLSLEYASSSQQVFLKREIQKQRRQKPLREIFHQAPELVTKLKPCFMMSPLSVAQHLRYDSIHFDVVILDEASQIMPHDAISSLIRADQAIIAGDTKQLPPTSFFNANIDSPDNVTEDLESILDEAATVLPEERLRWHYRSRTDELIAFSNQQYYDSSLNTFPENNPDVDTGVEFEYVDDGVYDRGGTSRNEREAERVVDIVEQFAENESDRSLGVVAFSSNQEEAIRDALEQRCKSNRVLDAFVSKDDSLEEFFIKSLEVVQGDERDVMIFSVGYGPDHTGTVSMNFGPLNKTGGERRLNVAITRAREKVTVVSSLEPADIDLGRTNSRGVADFKKYLEYAKNGSRALIRDDSVTQALNFDSSFEEAVYTELEQQGYDVDTQVKSAGYSIDLAIKHPDRPGKYVLAIECDGAAYHSSKTARDRDRLRQSVLEDLGWTIHRIWSPDWTSNKQKEISTIKKKVDKLSAGHNSSASEPSSPTIEEYEPEEATSQELGGPMAEIKTYEPLRLPQRSEKSFDEIPAYSLGEHLTNLAQNSGPISKDSAYRSVIGIWGITRIGRRIRRELDSRTRELESAGRLVVHDEFLWPPENQLELVIRKNTEEDSREIDDISLEELGKAAYLILENGLKMTREDLALETTRMFGYSRTGNRIRQRVSEAVDLLLDLELAVEEGETISVQDESRDIDSILLSRVY